MNILFSLPMACFALLSAAPAAAWDGFDAATTALVEISPAAVPSRGDTVDVKDYETDLTVTCLVDRVDRNSRTVEVVVLTPDKARRTLVMELP